MNPGNAGEITNWSEVGGIDAGIVLIGRDASTGSGDRCTNIAAWVAFSAAGVHKDCR